MSGHDCILAQGHTQAIVEAPFPHPVSCQAVTIDVKFDRATLRGALPLDTIGNDIVYDNPERLGKLFGLVDLVSVQFQVGH